MSDPWAAVPHDGKLNDGTKELILNAITRQPRTTTQLAERLGISPPAVHRHVVELLAHELIREVAAPDGHRSAVERFYSPNFLIVSATERAALQPALDELATQIADVFRAAQPDLARTVARTNLSVRGESFETLLQYVYATATRGAREQLEMNADVPPWPEHADGSRWVWWAEETPETEVV